MDYITFQNSITDYLSENLSIVKREEFEQFLYDYPQHQEEFQEAKLFWNGLSEEIPEPTTAMDVNFYTMLNSQKQKENQESIFAKIVNLFSGNLIKQLSYTLAVLAIGLFLGKQLNSATNIPEKTIEVAEKETENVRSQLVLTLLDQPSANKRLQAVNEVQKLNSVTETIIKALFSTLNNDSSVNVRLSAVEALANYTNIPSVRKGLIASILKQDSPLVQIALADLMVILQEKKAVESFKKLIEKEDINESAKQKMKESINRII